ncbi:MAG TPA: serine hydrolase domain-containing protein [Chitinophagaceae bacterium]|nr:serine hydrolase domain-containing protein [Chitinophagaceae bacterium]
MSLKTKLTRPYFSVLLPCLLFFQPLAAQTGYPEIDLALKRNQPALGKDVVTLIYKSGKIVYENTMGDQTAMSQERIASCSKWYTAALVMTFVDEGKLSLEDTIGKFLPIFTRYGKGNIQVKHCLSHTLGLRQDPFRLAAALQRGKYNSLKEEVYDFAKERDKVAEPGTEFRYGNTGLNIAGHILEAISGKKFEELFQERIARPLGMQATTFEKNAAVANPSGGAWSTAGDYMNFLIMMLNKGVFKGKRIVSKASVEKMMEPQTTQEMIKYTPAAAEGYNYGLGVWLQELAPDGKTAVISSPGLFGTWPYVDYCRGYACIIFTRNLLTERKRDMYDAIKKVIDMYFASLCK